ncbi:MAG: hypothetical protein ACFFCP_14125 [Promethearchaeota archaeon]
MKTKWMMRLSCLAMFVLCLSMFTGTAKATMVWSDNFDDGNYDGWTTIGYENGTTLNTIPANFSAASGMLTVLDDDIQGARINSTTNVGAWSFDMYVPDTATGGIDVFFMSNGTRPYPHFGSEMISVEAYLEEDRFDFWSLIGANEGRLHYHFVPTGGLYGWHHFDVTRESSNRFRLFCNGTFLIEETISVVTTSTYFEFWCWNATGAAIDNIVVDDDPTISDHLIPTTTTTTDDGTTTSIPWDLIMIGGGVAVVVIILVLVIVKRR